ncbi:MAG: hypothetical protein EBR93_04880 [Bacteroidetes bacterium]|nr:hypothetical protein [Bacteroidota bacterium]
MVPDLLFHVVSNRKWKMQIRDGVYRPEFFREENGVETVCGEDLNTYLNHEFAGRKNLLLVVIETSRLKKRNAIKEEQSKRESDETSRDKSSDKVTIYRIPEPIHKLAVLDKIRIDCNESGTFDIQLRQDGEHY